MALRVGKIGSSSSCQVNNLNTHFSGNRFHFYRKYARKTCLPAFLLLVVAASLLCTKESFEWTFTGQPKVYQVKATGHTSLRGLNFDVATDDGYVGTPGARKQKAKEEKERRLREEKEERERLRREMEEEAQEENARIPILSSWPSLFRRLQKISTTPGSLMVRTWLQKGISQGYITVPVTTALRNVIDADVNVCLVSRRESSDAVAKAWQKKLSDVPFFDISGEVSTPSNLDPVTPSWENPLDETLPTDEKIREVMRENKTFTNMLNRFQRDPEELVFLGSKYRDVPEGGDSRLLREVVQGLPTELLDDEERPLVRQTVIEILKTLWAVHIASNSTRLRWRLACTDDTLEVASPETSLRAIFILAGEGLEFVPQRFVDTKRVSAERLLSTEQLRRMGSEDWARSLTAPDTNITEALKRVPAGWTTVLKGDSWPKMKGRGAQYRLPQTGKRLYIEVDFLSGSQSSSSSEVRLERSESTSSAVDDEEPLPDFVRSLGPFAAFGALIWGLIRSSPTFKFGQQRRKEVDEVVRSLTRAPDAAAAAKVQQTLSSLEQRMWMEFTDADKAPVVLVVGSQSQTGQVILRKLLSAGYHCVVVKDPLTSSKALPQGSLLTTFEAKLDVPSVYNGAIDPELYKAVSGVDKIVICDCDRSTPVSALSVRNVLTSWQIYRRDFLEKQRAYSSKVRLFNFDRETDFELWDLERQKPTDMCYGTQRAGWTRNRYREALFVGQFYEEFAQTQLKSPIVKLNFKRFSGLIIRVYNQAVDNKYSWFLRTSDFDRTRIQYEFEFECKATSWHTIRIPFNCFKPIRSDGVPLPEEELEDFKFNREDVIQMGCVVRTNGKVRPYEGGRLNYFSLVLRSVKVFRTQTEPQVIYVGRASRTTTAGLQYEDDVDDEEDEQMDLGMTASTASRSSRDRDADKKVARDIEEMINEPLPDARLKFGEAAQQEGRPTSFSRGTPAEAVLRSGLAFSILKVKGLNDNPGGKFPVSIQQAAVDWPHLSTSKKGAGNLKTISRGDVAALVIPTLSEPSCVNVEVSAGELARDESEGVVSSNGHASAFAIGSTLQDDVKSYLKQLVPNS